MRISDVTSSRKYLTRTQDYLSDEGVQNSVQIKVGEVILSICATIGRPIITATPVCIHDGFVWFDGLSEDIDREYFYYYLASKEAQLANSRQTGTQGNLNTGIVSNLDFLFPTDRIEQAKIAEVLSTIDRFIDETQARIMKQERIKTGLMQALLTRGIDEEGRLRSEKTHKFKNSAVGRIPAEWDPSTLEDVGDWMSGGTPSKSNPAYWGDEVPWVCPKDMKIFDLATTTNWLTCAGVRNGSREAPANSVFIVVRGMILAHTFPVCISSIPMAFNQDVKAIVAYPGVDPRFLAYWFVSNGSRLLKITTTATHGTKRFDTNELFEVPIALPKKGEQSRIIERLDAAEMDIANNRKTAAKLRSLRSGLMQDLLSGRKRVTRLLEISRRIAAQGS